MPNNTDPAREAAIEQAKIKYLEEQTKQGVPAEFSSREMRALNFGFDAGIKWLTDGDDFKTAQKMLRGAIEEMQKPAARKEWVAVETEADLPTETGEYIVTTKTPSNPSLVTTMRFYVYWMSITDEAKRLQYLRHEHWLASSSNWHVIAWKPLPEPYGG